MRVRPFLILVLMAALLVVTPARAHVNSPHSYREATVAGLRVVAVVHLPVAVPGEARAELRVLGAPPGEQIAVSFRQIPPQGTTHAPGWTPAQRSESDPAFFTSPMPLMVFGLFEAEFLVKRGGPEGVTSEGVVSVPVTARNPTPRAMSTGLIATLVLLSAFLAVTACVIFRAVIADSRRDPSLPRAPAESRRGLVAGILASAGFLGFVGFTGFTWHAMHLAFQARTAVPLQAEWLLRSGTPRVGAPIQAVALLTDRSGVAATNLLEEAGQRVHVTVVDVPTAQHVEHLHGIETAPGAYAISWTPRVPGRHLVFVEAATREAGELTIVQEIVVGPSLGGTPLVAALPADPLPPIGEAPDGAGSAQWPPLGDVETGELVTMEPRLAPSASVEGAEMIVFRDDFQVFARFPASHDDVLRAAYGFPQPGRYRAVLVMPGGGAATTSVIDVSVRNAS